MLKEMNKIICGDCIKVMKTLDENSVDAIVTDPPYGLEFMGKEWDKFRMHSLKRETNQKRFEKIKLPRFTKKDSYSLQQFMYLWATEAFRILKPGAFMLVFGGTRTYHRMACGIEDAGFEIRDCIQWIYGSGFPKSLNIGKQVDKIQGNEREVVGKMSDIHPRYKTPRNSKGVEGYGNIIRSDGDLPLTKGNSEWEGWGTALKPANEPIVVARKPLSEKNVALNVLKHGTGGINIDACRINYNGEKPSECTVPNFRDVGKHSKEQHGIDKIAPGMNVKFERKDYSPNQQGRFPANVILDEEAGQLLDEQSGELLPATSRTTSNKKGVTNFSAGNSLFIYKDKGGASRFFYCAKASKSERNLGETSNKHPTVKPLKLMQYLVRLVTPPNGVVLDPFIGSGTTAMACKKEGFNYIGIEQDKDYCKIAEARIKAVPFQTKLKEEK